MLYDAYERTDTDADDPIFLTGRPGIWTEHRAVEPSFRILVALAALAVLALILGAIFRLPVGLHSGVDGAARPADAGSPAVPTVIVEEARR